MNNFANGHLFEVTFKKYEQNIMIIINQFLITLCYHSENMKIPYEIPVGVWYFGNFFYSNLKMEVKVMNYLKLCGGNFSSNYRKIIPKFRKFYKELRFEYDDFMKDEKW